MTFSFLRSKNYSHSRKILEEARGKFFTEASIGGDSRSVWLAGYAKNFKLKKMEDFFEENKIQPKIEEKDGITEVVISLD